MWLTESAILCFYDATNLHTDFYTGPQSGISPSKCVNPYPLNNLSWLSYLTVLSTDALPKEPSMRKKITFFLYQQKEELDNIKVSSFYFILRFFLGDTFLTCCKSLAVPIKLERKKLRSYVLFAGVTHFWLWNQDSIK